MDKEKLIQLNELDHEIEQALTNINNLEYANKRVEEMSVSICIGVLSPVTIDLLPGQAQKIVSMLLDDYKAAYERLSKEFAAL